MNSTQTKGQLQVKYDIAVDPDAKRYCCSVMLRVGPGDN